MKPVHFIIGGACVIALLVSGCISLALLLPAIISTREAARRTSCSNHFKMIGLGMHNYHSSYKQLPPGCGGSRGTDELNGNRLRLNGLAALLPFVEEQALWGEISKPYPAAGPEFPPMGPAPWVDATTYPPFAASIQTFQCPSNPGEPHFGTNFAFCYGDTVRYVGMSLQQIDRELAAADGKPLDAYSDGSFSSRAALFARAGHRGMFMNGRELKFRDVLDGLANTIAMTEVSRGEDRGRINAYVAKDVAGLIDSPMECISFTVDPERPDWFHPTINTWDEMRGYRWADGNIRMSGVTTVLPPNRPSCTLPGSEMQGIFSAGSHHAGGCHVLMADGAVIFITDSIDVGNLTAPSVHSDAGNAGIESPYGLWGALGTRASKESF